MSRTAAWEPPLLVDMIHENTYSERKQTMRFMMIIKANEASEAGEMPSREMIEAMNDYNEEMLNAGVMLAGEGLHPSSEGARIYLRAGKRTVTDGPFAETKEVLGGYYMIKTDDLDLALEAAARCPGAFYGSIEVRPIVEM